MTRAKVDRSVDSGMARPRILLAHTNADCRLIYSSVLTYDGCDVDVTADVESALALASKSHYDVVIADLYLPNEGDECLLRVLKATPSLAHLPVVILTGWTTEKLDFDETVALGVPHFS